MSFKKASIFIISKIFVFFLHWNIVPISITNNYIIIDRIIEYGELYTNLYVYVYMYVLYWIHNCNS